MQDQVCYSPEYDQFVLVRKYEGAPSTAPAVYFYSWDGQIWVVAYSADLNKFVHLSPL